MEKLEDHSSKVNKVEQCLCVCREGLLCNVCCSCNLDQILTRYLSTS